MASGYNTISTLNPQQQQGLNQLFGMADLGQSPLYQQGSNYLSQLLSGSPEAYQQFEAPFMRQFREQTIPGLSTLFAGAGAGSSSAFQQALGQSGAGLSEGLASLRGNMQQNALPQALGYAQQPFNNLRSLQDINTQAIMPKQSSFLKQLLLGLSGGASQGIGSGLGFGIGKLFG